MKRKIQTTRRQRFPQLSDIDGISNAIHEQSKLCVCGHRKINHQVADVGFNCEDLVCIATLDCNCNHFVEKINETN